MRFFIILLCLSIFGIQNAQETSKKLNDSAIAIYKNNPKKAILLLEESSKIASDTKNNFELARSKNALGLVYRDLGDFQKAIAFSQNAMQLSKDSLVIASALNNIGASYRKLGAYEDRDIQTTMLLYFRNKDTKKSKNVYNYNGFVTQLILNYVKFICCQT